MSPSGRLQTGPLREEPLSGPICSRAFPSNSTCRSGWGPVGRLGDQGFTVIELLSALVIAAILIGAATPSFLGLIRGSRLNAATRQIISEIRAVQSMAVTRGDIFGFHWGADPFVGLPPSQYRIERDPSGTCAPPPAGWPAPGDTAATVYPLDPNPPGSIQRVIRDWFDLSVEYPGIVIQSVQDANNNVLGGVMFNSQGASVNTCTAVSFPVTITIADGSGDTRTIRIRSAGSARIL